LTIAACYTALGPIRRCRDQLHDDDDDDDYVNDDVSLIYNGTGTIQTTLSSRQVLETMIFHNTSRWSALGKSVLWK